MILITHKFIFMENIIMVMKESRYGAVVNLLLEPEMVGRMKKIGKAKRISYSELSREYLRKEINKK
jgi:hypothetical protein